MARDYLMFFRNRPIARGPRAMGQLSGAACGWVGYFFFFRA